MHFLFGFINMYNTILCVIGTFGFCYILNAPKKKIIWILIGSLISGSMFEIMQYFNFSIFISTATASILLDLYCEGIARVIKTPSTVILLPATIPLLPGGALYYAMQSFVNASYNQFKLYALETISTGFGIAFGIILTMKVFFNRHSDKDMIK